MSTPKKTIKPYEFPEKEELKVSEFVEVYHTSNFTESMLHKQSKKGVNKAFLEKTAAKLGLTIYEIAPLLHISSRTLLRYKSSDIMDIPVSEHILSLERLISEASELFDSKQVIQWINSELPALDFKKPLDYMDTIFGIDMVRHVVGRIKHGIYS
ncbi:MAG: antitoxin Xre/MbcA/ParS toxin-binding domain-containing protein [Bacteroidota bacterium]|nr:antitoxin Xre/MbcA/ParS toxin-binding domain-containing protein [Bacteroidota bacterium]